MSQAVTLISESFIRPKIEVNESKRVYHLNPFELSMLSLNPIQIGLVFKKPNNNLNFSLSSHLQNLKPSLSLALSHFYPLAGQLVTERYEDERSCCIYVDGRVGPGAKLIHAIALDVMISDVVDSTSDIPLVVRSFFDVGEMSINHDGHTRPLLSVQVTELKDGVFLGVCANHSVVDGTSFEQFIKLWSSLFIDGFSFSNLKAPLLLRKTPFLDQYGEIFKLPYLDVHEFLTRSASNEKYNIRERYFRFSTTSMKILKAKANKEIDSYSKTITNISSLQALIGLVWRSITRARKLSPNEVTSCALPVNIRQRFDPPLSVDYFGVYFRRAKGCATAGELLDNDVGYAAMLLNQALVALDDDAARNVYLRALDEGPELLVQSTSPRSNHVVVAGSPRFEMYMPEFGLGKSVAFHGGFSNKYDGKMTAFMGSKGHGSVDLEICLAPDTMDALLVDNEFMCFVSHQHAKLNLVSSI